MPIFDNIVYDDLEQEAQMPKQLVQSNLVSGDLTGLINEKIERHANAIGRAAFVFRGPALSDLALSALVFQRACETSQSVLIET